MEDYWRVFFLVRSELKYILYIFINLNILPRVLSDSNEYVPTPLTFNGTPFFPQCVCVCDTSLRIATDISTPIILIYSNYSV